MMSEYSVETKFIDLGAQQSLIRDRIDEAIKKVLDHGNYIMGPEVKDFESRLCKFTKAEHSISCANGTDAISIALMSWDIGPGDVVFVPSFTYVATAEAPAQLGATPFFVDVDRDSFNIDPESLKQAIKDCIKLGLKPSAVIAVDLFGQPCNIDQISDISHEHDMKVLIDGAQSFGAISRGRRVGSMGDATTTSFFPAKPLGCYGDGGAIFTNNENDASMMNSIRLHGKGSQKYDNIRIGLNSRLDTIQAAILIEKLCIFEDELKLRTKIANIYSSELNGVCKIPILEQGVSSSWAQYTLQIKNRDCVIESLKSKGVPSIVYYPIPLSMQKGYEHYPSVSTGTSNSEYLSSHVLSLPMHPYLSEDSQERIINHVKGVLKA